MIKDLKNVIITFGLIALVLTQGSLFYQKKVKAEYILATQQSELQNIKKNKLAKIAQDKTLAQLKQQEVLIQQQIAQSQSATPSTTSNAITNQAQIDLAKKQATLLAEEKAQAQLLAQQRAQAQLLAQQQAQANAQAQMTMRPSRQSRAS